MNQRVVAALLALPMVLALVVVAWIEPLPYVTYHPGPTVDVLGENDGKEIISVADHKTYRDDGELRMTTVSVSQRDTKNNLFTLMGEWLNPSDAVYPYDAVYEEGKTEEQDRDEGQTQMVVSQDAAAAVALRELGEDVKSVVEIVAIEPGMPGDGALALRDVILAVNGEEVDTDNDTAEELQASQQQVIDAVRATEPGETVTFTVRRDGEEVDVPVVPKKVDDVQQVGVQLGEGFILPFDVSVGIDPSIGGPSAGLMFSLAIYDTLTPGSLTGGATVAGTGEIASDGTVGPIGGIQQKIVGAREAGAELFLVPADNCESAEGARNGDMILVKAETMHSALTSIEKWVKDPDVPLPSCDDDKDAA